MSASKKTNPPELTEDFLEVDQRINGQNFVCLSFVSPEKILKKKETFFTSKFINYLINSEDRNIVELRESWSKKEVLNTYQNTDTLYNDWIYSRRDAIEKEFFELNDFQTTVRGLKVRGVYDTEKEATTRANILHKRDPNFHVFVAQVGYWLPWDPSDEDAIESEYQENHLNNLVKKYKENFFEQEKNEKIRKAREDARLKREALLEKQQQDEKLENPNPNPNLNNEDGLNKINELRTIVDESDKLFYDNLSAEKNQESATEQIQESATETVLEKNQESALFQSDDPWMNRKNV